MIFGERKVGGNISAGLNGFRQGARAVAQIETAALVGFPGHGQGAIGVDGHALSRAVRHYEAEGQMTVGSVNCYLILRSCEANPANIPFVKYRDELMRYARGLGGYVTNRIGGSHAGEAENAEKGDRSEHR